MSNRVRISAMTYGPHGVGRLSGKAVFVRGVVPGEEVEIEIRERHDAYDYADLVAVSAPSSDRRHPPCIYLPRCGGCPWQHLSYPTQLEAKRTNLNEALHRIARLPELESRPVLTAGPELGYRSRLTLRVEKGELGFVAGGTHDLVTVTRCLLANEEVDAGLLPAAKLASSLRSDLRRLEIVARGFERGLALHGEVEGALAPGDGEVVESWLQREPTVAGITLVGKRWRQSWGDDRIAVNPEPDLQLITRAGAFTQVNPNANLLLVRQVLDLGEVSTDDCVLDLYSGAGNLSLPIARRVRRVVAVEQDAHASRDGAANADRVGLTNIEFITGGARRAVRTQAAARAYFDLVVLDPPRSGAAEVMTDLLELSPRRLIYVSCNPSTLARDLKTLADRYRIDVIQPIDLFPQTYHLETVVRATRR